MKLEYKKIILSIVALLAAGVSPNLFVLSQAGYAQLNDLAISFLLPSIGILLVVFFTSSFLGVRGFNKKLQNGFIGGLIGTIGLEIIREIGFHLGGMPGDMPKLLGVLLLNQFASGPDAVSNIAGWSYHFWNGASFGIIYSIVIGKGNKWTGLIYGILVAIGFMASPVVVALGVGRFGVEFGWGFPATVILAHIAFGFILGWFIYKRNPENSSIFNSLKNLFTQNNQKVEQKTENKK